MTMMRDEVKVRQRSPAYLVPPPLPHGETHLISTGSAGKQVNIRGNKLLHRRITQASMFSSMADLYTLQDPTKQYPLPKFKRQPQRVPGIARKMQPKPDHGETSYRGCGRLPNRKALVTGGGSGIGRAAAIAFASEGADVVISYLPSEEADTKEAIELVEAAGRRAYGIPGDVSNESFCRKAHSAGS